MGAAVGKRRGVVGELKRGKGVQLTYRYLKRVAGAVLNVKNNTLAVVNLNAGGDA